MSLELLWAGRMYGTNTGNVFVELKAEEDKVEGLLRVNDEGVGVFVYNVAGTFSNGKLELEGAAADPPEGVQLGTLKVAGALSAEGSIRGTWETTIGTGGTFILHPHNTAAPSRATDLPERIHTVTRPIGAVRLYSDDFKGLVETLQQDFEARPVVTYRTGGIQVSRWASEVLADVGTLGEHRYLQVTVQQPEAYGINRGATVELNADGANEVRVQGVSQTWVLGKAEALSGVLRRHERKLQTMLSRHGLSIYMIIFFAAFAFMPELPLYSRLVFLAAALTLLIAAQYVHRRLVPIAMVHLSARKPSILERAWPSILSLLIATGATVAGGIAFEFIRRVGPVAKLLTD